MVVIERKVSADSIASNTPETVTVFGESSFSLASSALSFTAPAFFFFESLADGGSFLGF